VREFQQPPAARPAVEQPSSRPSISKSVAALIAGGRPWDAKVRGSRPEGTAARAGPTIAVEAWCMPFFLFLLYIPHLPG
jgi:hypothetical protein